MNDSATHPHITQHKTIKTHDGYEVTLTRHIRLDVASPLQLYWHDPNTGDVYNIDDNTGEVSLIFRSVQ